MTAHLTSFALLLALISAPSYAAPQDGAPKIELRSATSLTFGPDGVLFVADPQSAAIVAVPTPSDVEVKPTALRVEGLDAKIAGITPAMFTFSGKWLLCAHQDSNTLASLPLDPATGKLGAPAATAEAPNPICLIFLR